MTLIAQEITFAYESEVVIEKASFKVKTGELIGIIGPNGGGKTTLLKLLIGLLKPQSGSIQSAWDRIGYVPQAQKADPLFPLSALEVVLMGDLSRLGFLGSFSSKDKERAHMLLEQVGLEELASRPFSSLSGGERQRVLFARAWMCDPDVLFLDEPTASCDFASQEVIYERLGSVKGKKTVFMVTHNLDRAIATFDRLISVNRSVQLMVSGELCEHFALGLYHTPLANSKCYHKKKERE